LAPSSGRNAERDARELEESGTGESADLGVQGFYLGLVMAHAVWPGYIVSRSVYLHLQTRGDLFQRLWVQEERDNVPKVYGHG